MTAPVAIIPSNTVTVNPSSEMAMYSTIRAIGDLRSVGLSDRLVEMQQALRIVGAFHRGQAGVVAAVVGLGPVGQLWIGEVGVDPSRSPRVHGGPRLLYPARRVRSCCGMFEQEPLRAVHEGSRLRRHPVVGAAHGREVEFPVLA